MSVATVRAVSRLAEYIAQNPIPFLLWASLYWIILFILFKSAVRLKAWKRNTSHPQATKFYDIAYYAACIWGLFAVVIGPYYFLVLIRVAREMF